MYKRPNGKGKKIIIIHNTQKPDVELLYIFWYFLTLKKRNDVFFFITNFAPPLWLKTKTLVLICKAIKAP